MIETAIMTETRNIGTKVRIQKDHVNRVNTQGNVIGVGIYFSRENQRINRHRFFLKKEHILAKNNNNEDRIL